MEQLVQKYIRYFYITLISGIIIQLISTIYNTLRCDITWETFALMFLSISNIVLLFNNLRHNVKQQFTECKINSKIMRYSLGLLLGMQGFMCYTATGSLVLLINHLMTVGVVEIILSYRIKTIEYLEQLANKYQKRGDVRKCQE